MSKACAVWFASLILLFGYAQGRPHRVSQLPNGEAFSCALCHTSSAGGGDRNAFGLAIEAEFLTSVSDSGDVLWGAALAGRDSDGDGYANGQELGDSEGVGVADEETTATNPGDASDFPMTAFQGASLDLDDSGQVEASDFDVFSPRFVSGLAGTFDASIDFDLDSLNTSADLSLLLQNLGVSAADTSLAPATAVGPNLDVLATLDFETGNSEIDGSLSGTVDGSETVFELEVFLNGLESDLSAVELILELNSELVKVSGFSGQAGMIAVSNTAVVLANLSGIDVASNGYLGTLQLTTVSDVTGIPVRVELVEVVMTDRETARQNRRAAGGIGVTANPLDSVLPDLNGDGFVDDSDSEIFTGRFVLGVGRQDARFDETIDFDLDQQLTEEDVLLFMLNYGRSQETFTSFLSSESGPNTQASIVLDFQAGNFENDGVTKGEISGDGEVFSFDIFVDGIASDIALVSITFGVDLSEVSLLDYEPPLGMTLFGTTDSSAVFGVVGGQDASDGYLGRVDFLPASDLTGIPTPVAVTRVLLAASEPLLTDEADVSAASLILNEVIDDLPATEVDLLAVELDSVEIEEDTLVDPGVSETGTYVLSFILNAPLIDATDDFGDPLFAAGLPQFSNFKAFLMPDPFTLGGSVEGVKSFDEERFLVTFELPEGSLLQATGSAVPEFSPQKSADYFVGSGSATTVSGSVTFGTGLDGLSRLPGHPHVLLLTEPMETLIDGLESDADILDALSGAWVRGDYLGEGDAFELQFVPPGTYYLAGRLSVEIEGEPRVVSGTVGEPLVIGADALEGLTIHLDLPLEQVEIRGVVLAAIEFEGDNMFVEDQDGNSFEVLAEGASLSTLDGTTFDDVTQIAAGDSVRIAGSRLGPDRIRADSIVAEIEVAPAGPASDFSGDGIVDFTDFLVFALGFGKTSADADFDSRMDLGSSGDVGFTDFLFFVGEFGTGT